MNKNRILITCIRGLLSFEDNFDVVRPEHADWICERLFWHKVMPLAASINDPGKTKCQLLEKVFRKVLMENKIREEYYFKQASKLFQDLSDASIDFIPYKGPFWGKQIYPEYSWRHIGDIDLLMTRENARTVSGMLQEEGYLPDIVGISEADDFEKRGELTLFPGPFLSNQVPVQLHWELLPSPRFIKSRYLLPDDFFRDTSPEEWKGIMFRTPRHEVQFLYHVLHATCQHQFLRFSHTLAMVHFLSTFPQMDWDRLFRLAEKRNSLKPLYHALKFIHYFLPIEGQAYRKMEEIIPSPRIRIAASFLTPRSTLYSTRKRGGFRRKLFRAAMSW
jgi:hypothetical protein